MSLLPNGSRAIIPTDRYRPVGYLTANKYSLIKTILFIYIKSNHTLTRYKIYTIIYNSVIKPIQISWPPPPTITVIGVPVDLRKLASDDEAKSSTIST